MPIGEAFQQNPKHKWFRNMRAAEIMDNDRGPEDSFFVMVWHVSALAVESSRPVIFEVGPARVWNGPAEKRWVPWTALGEDLGGSQTQP